MVKIEKSWGGDEQARKAVQHLIIDRGSDYREHVVAVAGMTPSRQWKFI